MSRGALRSILLLATGAALGGAGFWLLSWFSSAAGRSKLSAGGNAATSELDLDHRSREIAVYEERVRRDPQGALDLAQLAGLYLQRARETGDHADLHRAEEAARRSLANSPRKNEKAFLALASSLTGQHRFTEAIEVGRALCAAEPEVAVYRAALGEIQLEIGDYEGADSTFAALAADPEARANPAMAPRLARWAEIMGRTDEALAILTAARDEAVRRGDDLPREQLAWFHLRVGDMLARAGRVEEAEKTYEAGLEARPGDHRLLAAMARLAMGRWQWPQAVEYARRAVSATATPEPGTLVLLGDAYAGLGDKAKAEETYREAERISLAHAEPYNRAWTSFLVEHDGGRIPEVVALLKQEIQTRRDIYGYDLLAWALFKQGDYAAAQEMMASALRTGTRDALIFFHAGMIEQAIGAHDAARRHFEQAIETNPYFHPTYPALARAALAALGGPAGRHLP